MRVTVIAAGFDGGSPRRAVPAPARRAEPATAESSARMDSTGTSFERSTARPADPSPDADADRRVPEPAMASSHRRTDDGHIDLSREPARTARPARTIVFDDADDLDIPDFLK